MIGGPLLIMVVVGGSRCGGWKRPTAELSDSRPAVITLVTLNCPSASPKPATLELRSGAAVRSSDFVRRRGFDRSHWRTSETVPRMP